MLFTDSHDIITSCRVLWYFYMSKFYAAGMHVQIHENELHLLFQGSSMREFDFSYHSDHFNIMFVQLCYLTTVEVETGSGPHL